MFRLGEIEGKKLTKYSTGLKSGATGNWETPLADVRNGGSGSFFVGNFTIPSAADGTVVDTYVRLDGFTKGIVWINGFNLGRYWPVVGPQVTLYLPASLLKPPPATNTFIVFELEKAPDACLASASTFSRTTSHEHADGDSDNGKCFLTLTDTHVIDIPTHFKSGKSKYFWLH